ncbi:MAG: hypothetical protein KF688_01545 [Pirellulales bacterium]|nr:hypothetical protein [Pirellulales bacterium]MBX3434200.1 hypothetical protein [Pirellulales bacterium]
MSRVTTTAASTSEPFGERSTLNAVNVDDFLKLMIAELQNQDPLNPLDNEELIGQIGQIRQIASTDNLTKTLDAVLLGQNISSATNLIGAEIDAISDDSQRVTGVVSRVSVTGGVPKLHLDLDPQAKAVGDEGALEAGDYEYIVTWQENGTTFGVDPLANVPGKSIATNGKAGVDQAILLSNLPKSAAVKQVYRREGGGTGPFQLVGTIADVNQSTYLDTKSKSELSGAVLTAAPQLIESNRTFVVSLKNVGEIRPPQ